MSLKYIQDGVPVHIAGGGTGDGEGVSITWEEYQKLTDKSGLYYVTGENLPDGDLSGSTVVTSGEGEVPTLPTITATQPAKIQKIENFSSLVTKLTEIVSNIRWLFAHLGDIRKVTGGTVIESGTTTTYPQVGLTITDAISNVNQKLTLITMPTITYLGLKFDVSYKNGILSIAVNGNLTANNTAWVSIGTLDTKITKPTKVQTKYLITSTKNLLGISLETSGSINVYAGSGIISSGTLVQDNAMFLIG